MKIFCFLTFLFTYMAQATPCPEHENGILPATCNKLKEFFCSSDGKKKTAPMSEVDYQTILGKIRTAEFSSRLQEHIQGAIQEETNLTQTQRQALSKIAKETHFVFEGEEAMELGLSDQALVFIRAIRVLNCGLEGSIPNASALYVEGRRIISICPGLVKRIVSPQQTAEEMADAFTFVTAHETGHFLFKENIAFYEDYKECLQDHPTHEQLAKESTMNIFKIIFSELRVGPHLNEIAADYWGNRAVAQMLKKNTRAETFRTNYHFICTIGNHDDGEHPGLDYRFDFLTRNDPGIANALQCPLRPGCRLKNL